MSRIYLPENAEQLNTTMDTMLEAGIQDRHPYEAEWFTILHYLRGCRVFSQIDYDSGQVQASYVTPKGAVPFKYEEVSVKFMTEVGRLMQLDIEPAIIRRAVGLDSLRKASASQATLTYAYPFLNPETRKRFLFETLVGYGTVGLLAYEHKEGLRGEPASDLGLEVVMPWELMGFPARMRHPGETDVIGRVRWVSYDWLKNASSYDTPKDGWPDEDDPQLKVRYLHPGVSASSQATGSDTHNPNTKKAKKWTSPFKKKEEKATPRGVPVVQLQEYWQSLPDGRMKRYIVRAGSFLIKDKKYSKETRMMLPMGIARRGEGTGFFGKSFVMSLLAVAQEVEISARNLFREAQNFTMFGLVGIPRGWEIDESTMQAGPGPRVFYTDVDPMKPNEHVEHIAPITSGGLPVDITNMGLQMMDRLSQQPQMITEGRAPGRVDSTPAINYLYQASTLPLGVIASSIASCYSTVYRAILGIASSWKAITLNMQTLTDDAIIGIQLDPTNNSMSLSTNALPHPVQVSVGIKSQKPVDLETRKTELKELRDSGVISFSQYRITARLEGLDLPLPNDTEWQNYRMAIIRNIILFNDGETPGELPENLVLSEYDNPQIHLTVINRLMASPEFALSSEQVQNAFGDLIEKVQDRAGQYPEQMGHPEELAEQEMQMGPGVGPATEVPAGMTPSGGAEDVGGVPGLSDLASMLGGGQTPQVPEGALSDLLG